MSVSKALIAGIQEAITPMEGWAWYDPDRRKGVWNSYRPYHDSCYLERTLNNRVIRINIMANEDSVDITPMYDYSEAIEQSRKFEYEDPELVAKMERFIGRMCTMWSLMAEHEGKTGK